MTESKPAADRGFRRHFEGWQALAVAGSIAIGAAALAIPRAVVPRELPLPRVDRAEEARLERDDRDRLARAEARPLPFLVRAAGESFRRFGAAEAKPTEATALETLKSEFSESIGVARKRHGDEALLDLRAAQTALFVRAVGALRGGSTPNRDATELGGAFLARAAESRWSDLDGRVRLDADEAACVFRIRWDLLAGLIGVHPFSPSLDEWRLYYRTLLVRAAPQAPELDGYIQAISGQDSEYPASLARGIIAYWDNRFDDATTLIAAHLAKHPTGPWRLRAQNYLLAAYARAPRS